MVLTAVFVALVFFYNLLSRRLKRTFITAPIIFTAVGLLIFLMPPWLDSAAPEHQAIGEQAAG
jgi:hypothetical protein